MSKTRVRYGAEYRWGKKQTRWERIKAAFWRWAERYCK